MKRSIGRKLGAWLMVLMVVFSFAACGSSSSDTTSEGGGSSEDSVATITLYPQNASLTSGLVEGYKGDYFESLGFDVEVWAYSDEKTNAILASGDLPDVMYVSKENLDTMIEAGMLLDLDDYMDQLPHVQASEKMQTALNFAREYRSADTGTLYCLPLNVGDTSTTVSLTDSTERRAVKLKWDTYEDIGAPEIGSFDDLIDVMGQMMEAEPTSDDGSTQYGTVLNTGSDTDFWACMSLWYQWQGYETDFLKYALESNMVTGDINSITDDDSLYYQGLKWYNKVYRAGLMDPDSVNNDRATQKTKVDTGLTMVPSGYLPGWAPTYYEYYIPDTEIYYDGTSTYGDDDYVIAISADTENLDASLAFLDMLADTDSQMIINCGPEGEFWEDDGNGNAVVTEAGQEYIQTLADGTATSTSFTLSTGETADLWNTSWCMNNGEKTSYGDGEGGYRCTRISQWNEVMQANITDNENYTNWQATTGYDTWKDWLGDHYHSSGPLDDVSSFCELPTDSMELTVDAIKDVIVTASWKMVYADTDEDFDELWDQMVSDCDGLGIDEIQDWEMSNIENAESIRDSLAD